MGGNLQSIRGRLHWICLGIAIAVLAGFSFKVPAEHARMLLIFKRSLPGARGVLLNLPSWLFIALPISLAAFCAVVHIRVREHLLAAVIYLLVAVLTLILFIAHREMMVGTYAGVWSLAR